MGKPNSKPRTCGQYNNGDFVYCRFTDQFGFMEEHFGFITELIENDYYIVQLTNGQWATVPVESIKEASRA